MSKHRTEGTKASGSILDVFRRSSKRGRYGSEPKSAAGVLASAGRRPVLAAIAVPTAAAASIVAAGFAVTPSAEEEQTQFTQNAAPAADEPDTSAAEKAAKDAEKKQKDNTRSLTVKEEEPAEDTQSSSASSSNSTGSSGKSGSTSKKSSRGGSGGSGSGASDSGKPKNTKASGKAGSCPASTYGQGDGFHGKKTANGERFNRNAMTAAHKSLPFNSRVKVTNTSNGKSVTVRINDRGPYHGNRCLDLSTAAMNKIGGDGVATVKWQVL